MSEEEKKERRTVWGWATSRDAEFWSGASSRADAEIEAFEGSDGGQEVWVQPGMYPDAATFLPDADSIIDLIVQIALDNGAPDHIDDPMTFKKGAEEALTAALQEWARKYAEPNFWMPVGDPVRVERPKASEPAKEPGQ